ncbi:MAG: HEAT repeat domain-containing protein [Desulfobacteraceae bacterium]|nr:MAG: HEAT repeat domain-containing protein [Desulfobacteraceae bacterium]
MAGKPQTFSKGQAEEVVTILRKQLLTWGLVFLAIFTGVTGLSLWGIKKHVEKIAIQRIAKQFEEPYISSLVKQVAEQQSTSILEQQVNPEVTRFKNEVKINIDEFDKYLTEMKTKYEQDYSLLSSEVSILKKRNEILKLGDLGTQSADRSALEELEKISLESEDASLKTAANSEIARIKSFWIGVTRLKGLNFIKNGEIKKDDDLATTELIQEMLSNPEWSVRALAAQALHKRKEKGVPEALVKCIKDDRNLEVIKNATRSFELVTGYERVDVFSSDYIETWWAEHGEETTAKLRDSQADQAEQLH